MRFVRIGLFASAAILAASCSASGGTTDPTAVDEQVETPSTASSTTTEPPTTTEAVAPPPTDEAMQAWTAMWDGVEGIVTDPDAASEAIEAVATPAVLEQLKTIYAPTSATSGANTPRTFVNNPVVHVLDDGTVGIDDCMFESPRVGNATIWYSGTLRWDGVRWTVDSLTLTSDLGCVPSAIADAAIAGYEAYWDARVEFWDPADPTHPLVRQTLTGAQLELIEALLTDHSERGWVLRGRAVDHPEVIEVRSPTEVAILDCTEQDPDRGLYLATTGERLPDIPPVAEGQRDLVSAVMILESGVWKVSDVQGQADVSCVLAPTSQGLPVV